MVRFLQERCPHIYEGSQRLLENLADDSESYKSLTCQLPPLILTESSLENQNEQQPQQQDLPKSSDQNKKYLRRLSGQLKKLGRKQIPSGSVSKNDTSSIESGSSLSPRSSDNSIMDLNRFKKQISSSSKSSSASSSGYRTGECGVNEPASLNVTSNLNKKKSKSETRIGQNSNGQNNTIKIII